jgi:hypothetical protein
MGFHALAEDSKRFIRLQRKKRKKKLKRRSLSRRRRKPRPMQSKLPGRKVGLAHIIDDTTS